MRVKELPFSIEKLNEIKKVPEPMVRREDKEPTQKKLTPEDE